jgi:hypothetical protein
MIVVEHNLFMEVSFLVDIGAHGACLTPVRPILIGLLC